MIRITTQKEKNGTVVTIDGQVAESDLGEIRRVRKSVKGAVVLNLRGLDACAVWRSPAPARVAGCRSAASVCHPVPGDDFERPVVLKRHQPEQKTVISNQFAIIKTP